MAKRYSRLPPAIPAPCWDIVDRCEGAGGPPGEGARGRVPLAAESYRLHLGEDWLRRLDVNVDSPGSSMHRPLHTHEISEIEPGIYYTLLTPCSCAVLPFVLAAAESHVWVVGHRPDLQLRWVELPVPMRTTAELELLRVRDLSFDFQLPTAAFVRRVVPRLSSATGVTLVQLERPVPDTLTYERISQSTAGYEILRENSWILTFNLRHGGDYAEVTAPERRTLQRILDNPTIASGRSGGELP